MLVILSGVAGAGKDTIKKELIKRMENVESLPSFTSRPIREGDIEGQTYNFVSKEEFEKMIENQEFYEYDIHHNQYYGTSRKLLNEKMKSGKIIVKDIDVNGTEHLKELLKEDTRVVTVFLRVPKEELKRRLEERVDKPSPAEVILRLNRFDYEESRINLYDYVLKNDDLEKTVQIIEAIIENEQKMETKKR
ncbi:MAG: AAA family ATPase [Clostridia bacterium]|nr:AAA family ATPase [Clostridia bacterium]